MTFPPVVELLPHRPPMVAIDAVVASGAAATIAQARVWPDHALLREGRLPGLAALELIAQTTAARRGLELRARGEAPRTGFVVGVPLLVVHVDGVEVGRLLRVVVRPVGDEGEHGLRSYQGEVHDGDTRIAEGTIQVFEPREGG
jgi:predicted hotdog family 3-hydroxylacyl-ACP dehydratase